MSILYEFLYLSHEDGVLEQNRTLSPSGKENILKRQAKILTHVGQSKKSTAVDSTLAVNKDRPHALSQKLVKEMLKPGIPVQNVHKQTILGIQTHVVVRKGLAIPSRTRFFVCAIDDMRNAVLRHERRR